VATKKLPLVSVIITVMIILSLFPLMQPYFLSSSSAVAPVYVGVSFCGNTTQQAQLLIDKVKGYTNLFVLQSGSISVNETATTEICDYATSQGLNIIVWFGWFNPQYPWQLPWVENARARYGDKLLGIYYYDEPGGIEIDFNWPDYFNNLTSRFSNASISNSTASRTFVARYTDRIDAMKGYLNGTVRDYYQATQVYQRLLQYKDLIELRNMSIQTLVADYALYWWDYLAGYDTVLTEFGSNSSVIQNIALTRGAANMQNKSWGAIITWKYYQPPYLDTGPEIYKQMTMAYQTGAKYIIIFDYPQIGNNPYGVLTDEHFKALQDFWNNQIKSKPFDANSIQAEAVLVLPKDYGWGMRSADDRIWLWGPDQNCQKIWDNSRQLIGQYGLKLDIVYDDPAFPVQGKYQHIYYWNQTLTD
jgi:hypothetical protein